MNFPKIPQASAFDVAPRVTNMLTSRVDARKVEGAVVTFGKKAADFGLTVVVMPIFAALSQIANAGTFVIKAPFVIINETALRALGHMSASLTLRDLLGHVDNFRTCIVVQLTAAACFFYFEQAPQMMLDVVQKLKNATVQADEKKVDDAAGGGTAVEKTSTVDAPKAQDATGTAVDKTAPDATAAGTPGANTTATTAAADQTQAPNVVVPNTAPAATDASKPADTTAAVAGTTAT